MLALDYLQRPGKDEAALAASAYIAWAVFRDGRGAADAGPTLEYLLGHEPATIESPYVAALVANALPGLEAGGNASRPYLERLEQAKRQSPDGSLVWWEQPSGARTVFHGSGRSGDVEATALATLAMLEVGGYDATVQGALNWLIEQKDARGTWHSTQATVLALKALPAGTETVFSGDRVREIEVAAAGKIVHRLSIPADEGDVVREVDLTPLLTDNDALRLTLTERSGTASGYQVVLSYRVRDERPRKVQDEPLAIVLDYDRTDLAVGETVAAVATLTNRRPAAAPMVIVELPIPPGFAVETADLDELVSGDDIARFEVSPRSAILYLRELPPRRSLVLRYRLRATMPVKATAAPARAYEYYDPDTVAMTGPGAFVVAEPLGASAGN